MGYTIIKAIIKAKLKVSILNQAKRRDVVSCHIKLSVLTNKPVELVTGCNWLYSSSANNPFVWKVNDFLWLCCVLYVLSSVSFDRITPCGEGGGGGGYVTDNVMEVRAVNLKPMYGLML